MKLLHIDASALGAHSVSRGLTAAVVAEFVRNHPGIEVTYRDLHEAPLAPWALPAGEDDPNAIEGAKGRDLVPVLKETGLLLLVYGVVLGVTLALS